MSDPRCGAHCGLDSDGKCVTCDLHGLCHMCVEEDWARKFEKTNALLELWKSAAESGEKFHKTRRYSRPEDGDTPSQRCETARKFESEAK